MTTNIGELLNAANEADAERRAKEHASKATADALVREQTARAIADAEWAHGELVALREHRPSVQRQVDKWKIHRVMSQSPWLTHARDFLTYTNPSADDYTGAGALPRLIEKLTSCDSTTPRDKLASLLQVAAYAKQWPHAARQALEAFVADLPAVEAAEQRRLEIEERYATLHTPKGGR